MIPSPFLFLLFVSLLFILFFCLSLSFSPHSFVLLPALFRNPILYLYHTLLLSSSHGGHVTLALSAAFSCLLLSSDWNCYRLGARFVQACTVWGLLGLALLLHACGS